MATAAVSLAACADVPRPDGAGPGFQRPVSGPGLSAQSAWAPAFEEVGIASWYGPGYQNRPTADGEIFDMNRVTAAHKSLPMPCLAEVTNLSNGRRVVVRVNDRGPYINGRVIDVSRAAASELGFLSQGLTRVRVRYLGRAD